MHKLTLTLLYTLALIMLYSGITWNEGKLMECSVRHWTTLNGQPVHCWPRGGLSDGR